jgi:hypothetical protein
MSITTEQLISERNECIAELEKVRAEMVRRHELDLEQWAIERDTLEAQVKQLREALLPFAVDQREQFPSDWECRTSCAFCWKRINCYSGVLVHSEDCKCVKAKQALAPSAKGER